MPTLSITTTTEQAVRVAEAYGARLNLGRDATGPEIKQAVIDHIKSVVLSHENRKKIAALTDEAFDPT